MIDDQNLQEQNMPGNPHVGNPITDSEAYEQKLTSTQTQEVAAEEPEQSAEDASEEAPKYRRISEEQAYNFRQLRDRAEAAERRAQELERYQQQLAEKAAPQEDRFDIEDDGLVEGKHLKKYATSVKQMQKELEETKKTLAQFHATSAEMQLRAKFNDFDRIVTRENLERLSQVKPALYRSIIANPDLKDQGEIAYEGIQQYLQMEKYSKQDKKIVENKSKPRSSSTVSPQASDSPLARAEDYDRRTLSDARRAELLAEMQEARSRA